MAENTKIEWATHTFNPWIGCTKVSPACMHCYAERDFDHRLGQVQWGPNGTRVLTSNDNWAKPLKWNRDAQKEFEAAQAQWVSDCCWFGTKSLPEPELKQFRKRVFCASLADVFESWDGPISNNKGERLWESQRGTKGWVPDDGSKDFSFEKKPITMDDVRTRLFALIDATPNLNWLLLTKRPENIKKMIPCRTDTSCDGDCADCSLDGSRCRSRKNIWLGCSVENQEYAEKRIPELLKCRDLAPVLFLSCEPLLGGLEIEPFLSLDATECCPGCEEIGCNCGAIDWVIAGGESGPEARPTDPDWFRSLRDQCQAAGVRFLFKQWGEFGPVAAATPAQLCKATFASYEGERLYRIGKAQAGRVLDGVTHNGFPNE
jgi:protein gp37